MSEPEINGKSLRKRGRVVVVDRPADVEVPLESIAWPDTTDITEEQIKNMAASLLTTGQIEPIVISQADKKGVHRGVVGRLRYEAMKYRWRNEPEGKTILCRVRRFKDDVDGQIEVKTWQLVENKHRREVPAMQQARQYRELYDLLRQKYGEEATINTLAMQIEELTGNKESRPTVQHYLSLTKLEPKTQQVLTGEHLSLRAGLELLRIENPTKQVKAAGEIEKRPDQYRTVRDVKWHVESFIEEERRDHQKQRLEKRAEQLRKEDKIVIVDAGMSYEQRNKYEIFYGEVPEQCKTGAGCPKLGILLSGNFQQKPMCTDKKCYESMQQKQSQKQSRVHREDEKKIEEERAKVYSMPLDERHWRLAVLGLIDTWQLTQILGVERQRADDAVWTAICKLSQEECQKLLLRKAVEEVLTGPASWQTDKTVKQWVVKEFGLTPSLFLKEED